MPPLAALLPLVLLVLLFDAYCLLDLSRSRVRHLPKWAWALVILFVSAPVGGVIYLAAGRESA